MNATSSREFPAWHFSMLNDADRNEKIVAAIRNMNVQGKTIFEIGTGAGLTAMIFAKHGAKKILTCESNAQLYHAAKQVFKKNGMDNKIKLKNTAHLPQERLFAALKRLGGLATLQSRTFRFKPTGKTILMRIKKFMLIFIKE